MTYTIQQFIATLQDIQDQNGPHARVYVSEYDYITGDDFLRPIGELEVALVVERPRDADYELIDRKRSPEGDWSLIIG